MTTKWANYFDKCQRCGTTKIKHKSKGFCKDCYPQYLKDNRETIDAKIKATTRKAGAQPGQRSAAKFTDEEMDALCEELIEWATVSKSIHLSRFAYDKFKRSHKYLYEISRSYPKFKEALEEAKTIIGMKITDTCWIVGDSGANPVFGEKYLAVYDKDYKDMLEWKAKLSKEKEGDDKELTIKVVNYSDAKIEKNEV